MVAIRLDQVSKPPGIPGQAREDLDLGTAVTATAIGGPFSTYLWELRDRPVDIVAAVESAAALSASGAASTSITPVDVAGTYAIRLAVDAGFGLGARAEDIADITFYAGPTLASDPTQLPRRIPAFGERTEHNVPDAIDPGGNTDGWAREWLRWFALIESDEKFVVAGARIALTGGGATITKGYGIASVLRTGVGTVTVTLATAMPDSNYGVVQGIRGTNGGMLRVSAETTTTFVIERADSFGVLVDDDFSFLVELGA